MTDLGDRLARVLHDAVPDPPHELDPTAIRASATQHRHRNRLLAPALAAAAVAAVAIGVPLAGHQLATHQQPGPQRPAVPSPPVRFTASEFRGAVVSHRDGLAERCTLPIARGPSALIGPDGTRLMVTLSGGDPTSPPANPRPDIALSNGNAIWGFAWLGSYCGAPARAIEIPLHHAGTSLRVPLRGPQPGCEPPAGASTLIDGIAGAPGEPVQPPRPEYSSLRLAGQIEPGTTTGQLAPIDLMLRTIGSAPITLDPCPAYAGRDYATAHSGGFSDPISSGYLPCTNHEAVIRPGHPLHWTIPATSLLQTPGTGAIPGSTVHVQLGVAGVRLLHLETTAHQ